MGVAAQAGDASFRAMEIADLTTATTMGVILETLPGAQRAIFARYHLGGCQGCAFSNDETLAELATRSEVEPTEMLEHLLTSHAHDSEMLMEPTEAKAADRLIFVDLRTREEHEAVAIPQSMFFTQELQQQLFAGDADARILLYDHSGKNVLDQVAWFRGHGMKETYGLRGGIDAWSREVDSSIPRYRVEIDD